MEKALEQMNILPFLAKILDFKDQLNKIQILLSEIESKTKENIEIISQMNKDQILELQTKLINSFVSELKNNKKLIDIRNF